MAIGASVSSCARSSVMALWTTSERADRSVLTPISKSSVAKGRAKYWNLSLQRCGAESMPARVISERAVSGEAAPPRTHPCGQLFEDIIEAGVRQRVDVARRLRLDSESALRCGPTFEGELGGRGIMSQAVEHLSKDTGADELADPASCDRPVRNS